MALWVMATRILTLRFYGARMQEFSPRSPLLWGFSVPTSNWERDVCARTIGRGLASARWLEPQARDAKASHYWPDRAVH